MGKRSCTEAFQVLDEMPRVPELYSRIEQRGMMDQRPEIFLDLPGFTVRWLEPEDIEGLQALFNQCPDYAMIVEGMPVSPTAAQELFQALPPGGSFSNKLMIGIFHRGGEIGGVLEGMRHYPQKNIWWIGLLLLAPAIRNQGLGRTLTEALIKICARESVQSGHAGGGRREPARLRLLVAKWIYPDEKNRTQTVRKEKSIGICDAAKHCAKSVGRKSGQSESGGLLDVFGL